ncbi:hypothetical protein D0S45_10620 [Marinifilum sp. JC120]|nr:hypothetical protein D0S45_10620 [Marinifilum sp. JC120]
MPPAGKGKPFLKKVFSSAFLSPKLLIVGFGVSGRASLERMGDTDFGRYLPFLFSSELFFEVVMTLLQRVW